MAAGATFLPFNQGGIVMRIGLFPAALVMAGLAWQANAEPASCESVGLLAKTVMEARQSGVAMQDVMQGANELTRQLLIAAYEQPPYVSAGAKQRAITNFQNDVYLECVKQQR